VSVLEGGGGGCARSRGSFLLRLHLGRALTLLGLRPLTLPAAARRPAGFSGHHFLHYFVTVASCMHVAYILKRA